MIRKMIIGFLIILCLVLCSIDFANADTTNSVIYGISGNALVVYDPNANMLNTYNQQYNIDDLATAQGVVFLTSRDMSNNVLLTVLSTTDYKQIKQIRVYTGTKDTITVDQHGINVYMLTDTGIKKINWISETTTSITLTGTFYSLAMLQDDTGVIIGGNANVTVLDTSFNYVNIHETSPLTGINITKITPMGVASNYYFGYIDTIGLTFGHINIDTTGGPSFVFNYPDTYTISDQDSTNTYLSYISHSNSTKISIYSYSTIYNTSFNSSSNNSAITTSNDGSLIYVASSNNNILQVYSTNSSYGFIGNITTPGVISNLYHGYKLSSDVAVQIIANPSVYGIPVYGVTAQGLNVTIADATTGQVVWYSITGSDGSINAYLDTARMYNITFANGANTISYTFQPSSSNSYYAFNVPVSLIFGVGYQSPSEQWMNQSQLSITAIQSINTTTNIGVINVTVSDPSALTTSVNFYLYGPNSTGQQALINTGSTNTLPYTQSWNVPNAGGKTYTVITNCTQYNGKILSYPSSYKFPAPVVLGTIIKPEWLFWISFIVYVIIAGAGTATRRGLISIFAAGSGFIFLGFGWFRWGFGSLGLDALSADALMGGILVCVTIFSLVFAMGEKEKYS